jgi:hypothetical protein
MHRLRKEGKRRAIAVAGDPIPEHLIFTVWNAPSSKIGDKLK